MAGEARHRVMVVGAGSIGERHVRCFLGTGRADVSFVEVRDSLRVEVAGRYPGARGFASLEAGLEGRPTVAVVATPAPLHVAQAIQLVERGIHVLIEKPLAVGTEGVAELCRVVRKRGVTAGVAYVYRSHPALAEMREAVRSGRFGRPVELVAVCGQHFPLYRPAYHETYYVKHESGGGAVQDALTHIVNAGEWLVGPTERVVADAAHQVLAGTEVEDTVHVLARQGGGGGGGVPASYSLNQHQAPNETTITVIYERGVARFEVHANRWRSMEKPGGEWADHGGRAMERDEWFTRQAGGFLDAVEGKREVACSLEEGAHTLRVNRAILESARGGGWVTVGGGTEGGR